MQEALGGEGVLPFHPDDTIKRIIAFTVADASVELFYSLKVLEKPPRASADLDASSTDTSDTVFRETSANRRNYRNCSGSCESA